MEMDAPDITPPTLTEYEKFAKRIIDHSSGANRAPLKGGIDVTSRCNLKCAHCYIAGTPFEGELTYAEVCHIFDQMAEAGCLWLLITGGEPLLRPDFADIYRYAKRKGFIITLFTNGTLLTPRLADLMKEERPHWIEISLYGMTAATYERVTGVPGSFERCRRGIELLMERRLPLRLKTIAMTLNKHEIDDMKRYARSLGVEFRFDPLINPGLDGSRRPLNLRLSPEEVLELDLADEVRAVSWRKVCDEHWRAAVDDRLYTCGAGTRVFHITAAGDIAECVIGRRTKYNVLRGSFREGFYQAIPGRILAPRRTRYSECRSCPMTDLCGSCPALAMLECGDPEGRVDYLCRVAHLRAAAFKEGWPVAAVK
jgi:radical SAM protein with 4Fe4S-binding SPASM domain